MPFMLYVLQLPSSVLFIVIISASLVLGVSFAFFGRRIVKFKITDSHNEFVGLTLSIVAGLYGLVLAFVIFLVWDQFNDAQKTADMEGSHALEMYQDIKYYPNSEKSKQLDTAFISYVNLVVNKEYPLMGEDKKSPETEKAFDHVCDIIGKLRITNNGSEQSKIDDFSQNLANDQMLKELNEVTTYRNLRILSGDSAIPLAIGIPLAFGGFITLLLSIILNIENFKLHLFINGLLGCFIGVILYLIVIINHPFSGEISIKPSTYEQILDMANKK